MATPEADTTIVDTTVEVIEENQSELIEFAEMTLTEAAIYMGWAAELC